MRAVVHPGVIGSTLAMRGMIHLRMVHRVLIVARVVHLCVIVRLRFVLRRALLGWQVTHGAVIHFRLGRLTVRRVIRVLLETCMP